LLCFAVWKSLGISIGRFWRFQEDTPSLIDIIFFLSSSSKRNAISFATMPTILDSSPFSSHQARDAMLLEVAKQNALAVNPLLYMY
jgi:hypothetical protein